MKVGAQLYTVHDYTKTLEDFAETLKKVAAIGYKSVQVSGTCAFEPEWLAEQLKINGLTCDLTHTNFQRIVENPEQVVREHNIFGCKYIGVGSMPGFLRNGYSDYASFVEKAIPAAQKIKELGSYFMYHNHDVEYRNQNEGKNYITLLSENIPADIMGFTLDSYWVKAGGLDPIDEYKRLAGRIPCVHYKDMLILEDGTKHFAPIGSGILDFEKITEMASAGGAKFAFVEQDNCYGEDPFVCLKKSFDYLTSIGLEA